MNDTIEVQLVKGIPNVQLAVLIIAATALAWFLIVWAIDSTRQ